MRVASSHMNIFFMDPPERSITVWSELMKLFDVCIRNAAVFASIRIGHRSIEWYIIGKQFSNRKILEDPIDRKKSK